MSEEKRQEVKRFDPIATSDTADFHALRPNRYGETTLPATVMVHNRITLDPRASFALNCLEKWGLVMGSPDGEDSAGRAKGKIMPLDEVVARACDVADRAYSAFRDRGWVIALPSLQDFADAVKDKENTND